MINVGTGNLLLQHDDMSVPHKGVAMAFRRTYNSQSRHDTAGTDGAVPSLYGNGWTNTFDAHVSGSQTGTISVWDIDGARYDYSYIDGTSWAPPPGQHAALVSDGGCGLLWFKKSGTAYYFWVPGQAVSGQCAGPWYSSYGAYTGRLAAIYGRNYNSYIVFNYSWDGGISGPGGKVSAISAQTESGMTATMSFANVNGRRLLQTLTYPDAATNVQYAYDASGNLAAVSHPPNNVAGVRPQTLYGYQSIGSDSILEYDASPRWCGGASACGYDGSWTYFGFNGTSAASSTLALSAYAVTVNPTIQDGTNTPLYPGYRPDGLNYSTIRADYYTTGVTTPTFRDTDGHMTNWVVDGSGRVSQTQQCTAST